MQISFAKFIWKTIDRILSTALWLILITAFVAPIFILRQQNFDWNLYFNIFSLSLCIFILIIFVPTLPLLAWIKLIYLSFFIFFYYQYGYQVISSLLPMGTNYKFVLPPAISLSIQGTLLDFIFWSGLIFALLAFVLVFKDWILGFLAFNLKVPFAVEIAKERITESITELIEEKKREEKRRQKMRQERKKNLLILFIALLLTGLFMWGAFWWEKTYFPLLWKERLPKEGLELETGKTYFYPIFLKANGKTKYLRIEATPPGGLPVLYLEVILKDEKNKVIVKHSASQPIKPSCSGEGYNCHYFEQIPFEIFKDGNYNLSVTPYSPNISPIILSIREKK